MKTNRRHSLACTSVTVAGAVAAVAREINGQGARDPKTAYALLDKVRRRPVLKRDLFRSPVGIASIELLRDRDNFICRVRFIIEEAIRYHSRPDRRFPEPAMILTATQANKIASINTKLLLRGR